MKHLKLTVAAVVCGVLSFGSLLAAGPEVTKEADLPPNPYKQRPHSLGMQVSSIAGLGLAYKYAFADILHWRVTGMVFPSGSEYGSSTFSVVGTDFNLNIFQTVTGPNTFVRGYVQPAVSYWVSSGRYYTTKTIHAGATLGFELVIVSRFAVSLDLGFGYYRTDSFYFTTVAGGLGVAILF